MELVPFFDGVEKMKLSEQISDIGEPLNSISRVAEKMSAINSEPYIYGSYLEVWFRCLKLSKQYTQNCRTGLFGSQGAANTFMLFGSLEHYTIGEWWHEKGYENFGRNLTELNVRLIVATRRQASCRITLEVADSVPAQLIVEEFSLLVNQIRMLQGKCGMLSSAPQSWSIYKSRITPEAIKLYLDVLEAHNNLKHNAPGAKLWRIGEQMRLNPKAMTKTGDTPNEQTAKHIAMGHTVSDLVRKGQRLVANACEGCFPKY